MRASWVSNITNPMFDSSFSSDSVRNAVDRCAVELPCTVLRMKASMIPRLIGRSRGLMRSTCSLRLSSSVMKRDFRGELSPPEEPLPLNSMVLGAAAVRITRTLAGNSSGSHIILASFPSSVVRRPRPSITMITLPFFAASSRKRGNSQLRLSFAALTSLVNSNCFFSSVISLRNILLTLVECLVHPMACQKINSFLFLDLLFARLLHQFASNADFPEPCSPSTRNGGLDSNKTCSSQ